MTRQLANERAQDVPSFRTDYDAGKTSRITRIRQGLPAMGAGADYHLRNEFVFFKIMETARDMQRNDPIIARALDVSTTNIVQQGFQLDPQTGNKTLDNKIEKKWKEWSTDAEQCDAAATMTFSTLESHACGQSSCDGDIIFTGLETGQLQAFEADQCRTPTFSKKKNRIAIGVELSDTRRRLGYYLLPRAIDVHTPIKIQDAMFAPTRGTFYGRDFVQVFHVYDPFRVSQTRGITALAPVVNPAGMVDDLQLATLVQAQMVSCAVITRKKQESRVGAPSLPGNPTTGINALTENTVTGRFEQEFAPGMRIQAPDGYEDEIQSPNVPAPQYAEYLKQLISIIACNLGIPYIVLMMDASETNFSGWRGAFEEAKKGFRRRQKGLIDTFHTPVYRWKLAQWIDSGEIKVPKAVADPFNHVWQAPGWPYIEPFKDRQARRLSEKFGQTSPRRASQDLGENFWRLHDERIEDNVYKIESAKKAAEAINKKYDDGAPVTWRDVLDPEEIPGTSAFITPVDPNDPDPYDQKVQPNQQPGKAQAKKGAAA